MTASCSVGSRVSLSAPLPSGNINMQGRNGHSATKYRIKHSKAFTVHDALEYDVSTVVFPVNDIPGDVLCATQSFKK